MQFRTRQSGSRFYFRWSWLMRGGRVVDPIDKISSIPYYLQLADILKRQISERRSPHQIFQLPSENELATLQGITRATVRRALDVLESDGWIYREESKGSLAAVRRVEHEPTHLVSTIEDMRERGWALTTLSTRLEAHLTSGRARGDCPPDRGASSERVDQDRSIAVGCR